MKKSKYMTRALKSRDPRYAAILGKLGYGTRAMQASDFHPLDHDNDGKAGGSVAAKASDDLPALRAKYQDVMGKRAFPGWDADELRKRMAEAKD